jgi:hypothetical protein
MAQDALLFQKVVDYYGTKKIAVQAKLITLPNGFGG